MLQFKLLGNPGDLSNTKITCIKHRNRNYSSTIEVPVGYLFKYLFVFLLGEKNVGQMGESEILNLPP